MPNPIQFFLDRVGTPIGPMIIASDHLGNLRVSLFAEDEEIVHRYLRLQCPSASFGLKTVANPHGLSAAITSYFTGDLAAIDRIPVDTGGTDFQQKVWRALRDIPCGSTTSYGQLAKQIGHPAAVRAVGTANGANPVAVVLPCHRVIGASGSLTGYGGGIERKRWLLDHERSPLLF